MDMQGVWESNPTRTAPSDPPGRLKTVRPTGAPTPPHIKRAYFNWWRYPELRPERGSPHIFGDLEFEHMLAKFSQSGRHLVKNKSLFSVPAW